MHFNDTAPALPAIKRPESEVNNFKTVLTVDIKKGVTYDKRSEIQEWKHLAGGDERSIR